MNRFILNETVYFGAGSREGILTEISRTNYKRAFVVTDKCLIQMGIVQQVLDVLDRAEVSYVIFDKVVPNPTVKLVKYGLEIFKQSEAEVLIAIGGGSAIDTAKAIGVISTNPEFSDVVSLEGVASTCNKSIPIIAVATTAGTAAEVTINYVITDEKRKKKMVCVDPNDIPSVAIVDAELMYSLPKGLTASTGMDALTHAIEGYLTKGAWALSDMFVLNAIELIIKNLPIVVNEPSNKEAREAMALAQYVAGMGFSNVGLGLVHGMAHPLGAIYDIPHGVANALLLPTIMEFNAEVASSKYIAIAKAMGVYINHMNEIEATEAACDAVRKLTITVGIPRRLSELGVHEEDLPLLAKEAFEDVCTSGNPREVTEEEILELYKSVY